VKPQLLFPALRIWRCELQAAGVVLVGPGETVDAGKPVAEGQMPAAPVVVELGQAQAIVSSGQEVRAGSVVGKRKKLIGSGEEVRAPVAGKVLLVADGQILLQPPALTVTLEAPLPGTVASVRAGWSIDLEGHFGLLRGCGSSGQSHRGLLGQDVAIETEPLTTSRMQAYATQGIRALIAPSWGEPPLPSPTGDNPAIFLTESVPGTPMATPIAEMLRRHLGRPAALRLGARPLLGFLSEAPEETQCFGPGSWVRSADGRAGRLVAIAQAPRFFASGLRAAPADVDFGDRTETVPVDSLEWIA
jgi:hypothetical protein